MKPVSRYQPIVEEWEEGPSGEFVYYYDYECLYKKYVKLQAELKKAKAQIKNSKIDK